MKPTRILALGRLIPAVVGIALVLDVSLRLLPISDFSFRDWEAVTRYPTSEGPFTPNIFYACAHAYGDLASLGNYPALRHYHSETFTVDSNGFRSNPERKSGPPDDILIIGDSFAAGSGLSDGETLGAQLELLSGLKIYNAGTGKIDLGRTLALAERRHMSKGVVLYECLERGDLLPLESVRDTGHKPQTSMGRIHKIFQKTWEGFWGVNALEILAQRAYKRLQNDRCLPNPHAGRVTLKTLSNGRPILFLPEDERDLVAPRTFDIAGLLKLQQELHKHHLELRMLLVPSKYTVYAPLLQPPPPVRSPLYINRLEARLQQAGVPIINLLDVFQREAAARLPSGRYLYHLDDTHWNAEGVRLAAETIMKEKLFLGSQKSSEP